MSRLLRAIHAYNAFATALEGATRIHGNGHVASYAVIHFLDAQTLHETLSPA